jgi:glycosyltransferase involved in cell wall biosynthesis
MINSKRIAVVMPAYNAEKTLQVTVGELPELVDIRILVDDSSSDHTVDLARRLGLQVFQHDRNYGYGRNQQTCYREALAAGADVVIMLHPDYQYTPLLTTALASMVLTTFTTSYWVRALSEERPFAAACRSTNMFSTAC